MSSAKPWLKSYPKGIPAEIKTDQFHSIIDLFESSAKKYAERVAFTSMGAEMTFEDLNYHSADFASFLQSRGLKKGDRVALMMPNMLQYPIALYGVLRAGLIVVNTNPLYTAREMAHQLKDSGAKAIVIFANSASKLQEILGETSIETVVVTEIGDMLGFPKSLIVNSVLKYVKKMVPSYDLPQAISFYEALDLGAAAGSHKSVDTDSDDLAFLQYTGGTTGVAKGAELTHRNILSNMLQTAAWMKPILVEGEETVILALPLYHIFSLTVNTLTFLYFGGTNVMITNPRDIPDLVKTLKKNPYTVFVGLNTLFNALMNNEDFRKSDFSRLKISVAGGMALQSSTGKRWHEITKSKVIEGYGLTETSPVAICNPADGTDRVGTIGLPFPSTDVMLLNEQGKKVSGDQAGEISIRGPQVMRGYWKQPGETAKVMTEDGFFKTGDIGVMDADGFFRIVDRKKDMILVSGFNVYPNEVEDVISHHPKVLEVAAIGVPDEHSGEVVKVFVVKKDPSLTEAEVISFCKDKLTGYKRPKQVEFRTELPKSPVGKILRRELREPSKA